MAPGKSIDVLFAEVSNPKRLLAPAVMLPDHTSQRSIRVLLQ
jgi:hypothetical protein